MSELQKQVDEVYDHFRHTLGGEVPEPIDTMGRFAPECLVGYFGMRDAIMEEKDEEQYLSTATKELLFVVLDCVCGNLEGAKNHVKAAVRAGLTIEQLTEGLMQTMMVMGISTWGITGYKVVEFAAEYKAELEEQT